MLLEQKLWDLWVKDPGAIYALHILYFNYPHPNFREDLNKSMQITGVSELVVEKLSILRELELCDKHGIVPYDVQYMLDRRRVFSLAMAPIAPGSQKARMTISCAPMIQDIIDAGRKIKSVIWHPGDDNNGRCEIEFYPDDADFSVPYYRPDPKWDRGLEVKTVIYEGKSDGRKPVRKLNGDVPEDFVPPGADSGACTQVANLILENAGAYQTIALLLLRTFPDGKEIAEKALQEDPRTAFNYTDLRRRGLLDKNNAMMPALEVIAKEMFDIYFIENGIRFNTRLWLSRFKTIQWDQPKVLPPGTKEKER